MEVVETLKSAGIIPVIVIEDEAQAVPLANALVNGGLPVLEVTFRTKAAAGAIAKIKAEVPNAVVGAGTLLTKEQVKAAKDAGAVFGVAPGFDPTIVAYAQEIVSSSVSQSFRAGFEIVPNRNDIRYYLKRCAYRAGVYYDQSYYRLDGRDVNTIGLTLGVTLPVFRWYNGISLGVDLGQRASKKNDMIRERYAMFVVGFNIHDIWFQKPRYN